MGYKFDAEQHIHLLDRGSGFEPLYGTTTVIKEMRPPFLAKWGATCAMDYVMANQTEFVSLLTGGVRELVDEFYSKAVLAWSKVRQEAADKGVDMHSELEKYVQACINTNGGKPAAIPGKDAVAKFSAWAMENVDTFVFAEKNTYSVSLWTGGVVDCLAKLSTGEQAVLDFKSSKAVYSSHVVQAAGYALQLEESGYGNADGTDWHPLEGKIEALVIFPFGGGKPEKFTNVEGFKQVFRNDANSYPLLLAFNKRDK